MAVSTAYGMIHETSSSTATVRSVFVIDPDGVLKALTHYPLAVGRSVKECIRVIDALQHFEQHGEVCPMDWQKGDDAMTATHEGVSDYLSK